MQENEQDQIKQSLAKFNLAENAINEAKALGETLVILGVEDKAGFDAVEEHRKNVKAWRIGVENTRKSLNEDALAWQRAVNAEAKRITALLEPIEADLNAKSNWFKAEKERIKKEKEEAERRFIQDRKDQIFKIGGTFDGRSYGLGFVGVFEDEIKTKTAEDWSAFIDALALAVEEKRKAEEETRRILAEAEAKRREEAEAKAKQDAESTPPQAEPAQETPKTTTPTQTPVGQTKAQETPVDAFKTPGQSLFASKTPEEMDRETLMAFVNRLLNAQVPPVKTEKALAIATHARTKLAELGQELQRML